MALNKGEARERSLYVLGSRAWEDPEDVGGYLHLPERRNFDPRAARTVDSPPLLLRVYEGLISDVLTHAKCFVGSFRATPEILSMICSYPEDGMDF